ncbi:MAG: hypothetical protein KGL60_26915 [Pseudomonas sp.]|jgi:hypothetical protein|uniref:nSTAND3 domain-containing NTPase n=1 Tax=Pseudomonas sp. TaxID=306 RepID=UPI00239DDB8F|nr:hypothetical protein [Pseudomonas sp.]MDP9062481.1 hypothetical protein [Pseudomonadota bacterium]MDE1911484.1 hypothetical protein [Pseudomonas sp.]MDE2194315.1 hypothetical protein [Pseudomonas sp.]MDE2559466.1 hypothetical protein [Pseudomonas sp.]MDP9216342.1 hypothetical protein [Pseudomonadota bacterium]
MGEDEEPMFSVDRDAGEEAGSGAHSLAGYDYQVDISIWLSLDLMLGSGLTQMVELEPSSEEDLEAQLADDEPGRVATRVGLDGYTLVVQAKLRSGDAWTVKGISRVLKHGSATRLSAARRLASPTIRYLLVTSAALNGKTRGLAIKRPGSWPNSSGMPASMVKELPAGAAGRVAVIGNLGVEHLIQEIKRLLIERFGVPNSRWIECLRALREEARLRVRRAGEGRWRREDLAQVIRSHDGYLASSPQLDNYVHPRNWQDLRDAMESPKYAAIIIGQSGTGKTLATSKLYEELHRENPELTRVPIRSPQQLRDDVTSPPVLYDIEDPWGRYDFDPANRPWNDELAKWLGRARADRMIIATSRRDVAMSSGALKSVDPWVVRLEAEHYGKPERQRLYRTRIDTLPRDVRLLAAGAEPQVLDSLATPLEIEKFFDALRTMGRPQKYGEHAFIGDAIAKAHEQSIELTVVQQIEEREDVRAAAVIWGFLKASDHLSLQMLRNLELNLAESLPAFEKGIMPLVDFFVAARNLRSGAGDVSYYHPRVEAGVEAALKRHSIPVTLALRTLLDVLTDADGPGEDWGAGIAARIVAAAQRITELRLLPRPKAAAKIDAWLSDRLLDPSFKLSEYAKLAAAAGSPASNAAEFARYLLHRPDQSFGGMRFWESPEHPEAWYDRLRADRTTAVIAGRYIREMLPDDQDHYSLSFVDDLNRLAPDLTSAYLETAAAIVRYGVIHSSDVIAAGALRDLDGFETIVDIAIEVLTPTPDEQAETRAIHLAIINDVYNSDYAEHLSDNDDGYTAAEFLQGYADRIREVNGWRSLAQHRHAAPLLPYWMRSLMKEADTEPPSNDEIAGAFAAAFGSDEEDALWLIMVKHWDEQYREQLLSRVREGASLAAVRHAALACVIEKTPDSLSTIADDLRQVGKDERVVELMIDLAHLHDRHKGDGDKHESAATIALNSLNPELRELCSAAQKSAKEEPLPLSSAAITLLAKPIRSSPSVRALRIRRHLDLPSSARADIEWTLAHSDDHESCVEAIDAAIALGMTDITPGALDHRYSHVVAKALLEVGASIAAPLPAELLALAHAQASPVRKALVRLLGAKPHLNHLPVLLHLAHDQWSSSSRFYGEDDKFPIARSAVDAIAVLEPLDAEILEKLQEIALGTSDCLVRANLFKIIAVQGGGTFQERLLELAVTPGRIHVRRAAARAMLMEVQILDSAVIDQITVDLLAKRDPSIAAMLTLIAACRMDLQERLELARGISENGKRRALLLLMLWPAVGSDESSRSAIEQLLPDNHSSLAWVKTGPSEKAEDTLIADLGDPAICQEVLDWLNPKEKKA